MAQLDGRIALVTGGASGIGRAAAERLRDEGARVAIADVDEAGGRAVADALGIDFLRLDVSDSAGWAAAVRDVSARHGGLDIAYLNAGISTYPATEEGIVEVDVTSFSDEEYRRILGVNVDGVAFGVRAVAPALEARGGGAIVATASAAGLFAWAPDALYTLTKHAVIGLVRAAAPQLASRNITINAICPGGVNTPILGPRLGERLADQDVLMEPSQIADALVRVITSGKTGEAWVCLRGRDHQIHRFAGVEGFAVDA
ncbi:MAG: SDR family oxidoreductase [Myxococcota bacterium]